jgi:glycosyltransferase involved in cell wall biosynthesis
MEKTRIDVVLRTYNRAHLIEDALASILQADRSGIMLRVLIVDNGSTDGTPGMLKNLLSQHKDILTILHEPKPGGQNALNTAIARCTAPVIAFFDDDERVAENWLQVIAGEFADPATQFIAGPCLPLWHGTEPDWLPAGFGGVLGIIDNGPNRRAYGPGFGGMLTQGNCAVRAGIFGEIGPYPDALKTAEDRWLHEWLRANNRTGYYCPDMVIHHIMQESRINRAYFRDWAVREGRDRAACDRLAGVQSSARQPWYWRQVLGDAWTFGKSALTGKRKSSTAFAAELGLRQAWAYIRSG